MSTVTTDLQSIPTPVLDADPHAAVSHLQDARTYGRALVRYWIDLAEWTEYVSAGRLAIPVIATCATIIGAAIIGVNL